MPFLLSYLCMMFSELSSKVKDKILDFKFFFNFLISTLILCQFFAGDKDAASWWEKMVSATLELKAQVQLIDNNFSWGDDYSAGVILACLLSGGLVYSVDWFFTALNCLCSDRVVKNRLNDPFILLMNGPSDDSPSIDRHYKDRLNSHRRFRTVQSQIAFTTFKHRNARLTACCLIPFKCLKPLDDCAKHWFSCLGYYAQMLFNMRMDLSQGIYKITLMEH